MERGSVEGEVFHRGSVAMLSPSRCVTSGGICRARTQGAHRSTSPTFPEDEGFRFRHLLIRDAAYESLPKATRADLHERFAQWLAQHHLVERDEIVGYHLEQAHRYRVELDPGDVALSELGRRAAEYLGTAGRGAMDRGDWGARGASFACARPASEGSDARATLGRPRYHSQEIARSGGHGGRRRGGNLPRSGHSCARAIARADTGYFFDTESRKSPRRADEARAILEAAGDDLGLAQYCGVHGFGFWAGLQADAAQRGVGARARVRRSRRRKRIEVELRNMYLRHSCSARRPVPEAMP